MLRKARSLRDKQSRSSDCQLSLASNTSNIFGSICMYPIGKTNGNAYSVFICQRFDSIAR